MEYCGYGLYGGKASEETILSDSEGLMEFIRDEMRIDIGSLILIGRSIGSGPAVHLASKFRVFGLFLISPFLSIRSVVTDKLGSLLSHLVKERFNNQEKMSSASCWITLIHGLKDDIVLPYHSERLHSTPSAYPRHGEGPRQIAARARHDPLDQRFRSSGH